MSNSRNINNTNVDNVRRMIARKEGICVPFYATTCDTASIITDFDTFPYPRFFRGKFDSDKPIVLERESGFRNRRDNCYRTVQCKGDDLREYPNHCFEVACSTVFPCDPKDTVHSPLIYQLTPYDTCLNLYR
jgi:hypothetical protein